MYAAYAILIYAMASIDYACAKLDAKNY